MDYTIVAALMDGLTTTEIGKALKGERYDTYVRQRVCRARKAFGALLRQWPKKAPEVKVIDHHHHRHRYVNVHGCNTAPNICWLVVDRNLMGGFFILRRARGKHVLSVILETTTKVSTGLQYSY